MKRISFFAWGVLVYNIFVIVFGAFVRATGAGAGCGSHWPLCNGVVIPRSPQIETLIEWTHRLTSGVTVLLIFVMLLWVWRVAWGEKKLRYAVLGSVFFILVESLIGAGLVLFGLVGENASMARAISMMAHLGNTFMLLASLTGVAWFATFTFFVRNQECKASIRLAFRGVGHVDSRGFRSYCCFGGYFVPVKFPAGRLAGGL